MYKIRSVIIIIIIILQQSGIYSKCNRAIYTFFIYMLFKTWIFYFYSILILKYLVYATLIIIIIIIIGEFKVQNLFGYIRTTNMNNCFSLKTML